MRYFMVNYRESKQTVTFNSLAHLFPINHQIGDLECQNGSDSFSRDLRAQRQRHLQGNEWKWRFGIGKGSRSRVPASRNNSLDLVGLCRSRERSKFVSCEGRENSFLAKVVVVEFPGVDSRVPRNQSKVPLVSEEQSIVSHGLPKRRYSRLVQRLSRFICNFCPFGETRPIDRRHSPTGIFRIRRHTTPPGKFLYSSFRRGNHCVPAFQKPS